MKTRLVASVICLLAVQSFMPCQADPTVGAYYYPWWGPRPGGHTINQSVRAHLTPEHQLPAVGSPYDSRDADMIASHIDQSHLGNISMWSMSWWGPNRYEDVTIRDHILTHPRASELSYTVHYESTGRLGDKQSPDYSNLVPDFRHLANNIFNDPNYMRIDGRPVVVMYLSRVYFDDAAGAAALSNLRTSMQNEFGYDPYIIGDHFFGNVAAGSENLDAITTFDVYGQVFKPAGGEVNQTQINQLEQIYSNAKSIANQNGVAFVPGLTPGYNDKGVRDGNVPAPRYRDDLPGEQFGSAMEAMLSDAVLPHTDVNINELILVNSFNEWHEDTQIEPSIISPKTNTDDSGTGSELTDGRYYEGYGNLYLDILRNGTQLQPLTPAQIRWGRGTANGKFVGDFTDLQNWNFDDVSPDTPRLPTEIDRARVDRAGSSMTLNSSIAVNDFLFGVDEPGQAFVYGPDAEVTLSSNYIASFNQGDVTVDIQEGASLTIGGNFVVGQWDGNGNGNGTMDDRDITITVAGTIDNSNGVTILGNKYGTDSSGTPNSGTTSELVDVLLDITSGTLVTNNITFAPNGDLATFLATNTTPGNENTMGVRLGDEGRIVIVDRDATNYIASLVDDGLLYASSSSSSVRAFFDGTDTQISVGLIGDFNGDEVVDLADYTVWRNSLGASGNGLPADADGNGTVDAADYAIWKNHIGNSRSITVASSSVAEPSAIALAALALAFATCRITRGQSAKENSNKVGVLTENNIAW